ncbi:PD-(D/E)XK motif protein [Rhodococcus sp. CX]|uniref:PD-(D/E)XK motif protein n=1 Tax=Rhodococcus sp. CX TaxID=2789880 RepID=UPI0018CF3E58|nr:PD-(D/E)XK motif protein [Rhodococcus sp. CX]MBH0120385.1 PD-(D/E)XK motif protein [Rhodococcus sp. CX]
MIDRAVLKWSTVEYYLGEALAASYRLSHEHRGPLVCYEVDGNAREIALFVELDKNQKPPRSRMPAIAIDEVRHHDRRMARIRTTAPVLMRDFHDLALSVADRIVRNDCSLDTAYRETLQAWNALLDQHRVVGAQRSLGLHGELAMLWALAMQYGWETALESWTGPVAEEHDFAFSAFDIEVKTTSSERRRHSINGLDQLIESMDRPLWFVSIRLTRGGAGGRTLSESIDAVQKAAMSELPKLGARVTKMLERFRLEADAQTDERWTLRDAPLVLSAAAVPKLQLDVGSESLSDRIHSVRYEVDLTGLAQAQNYPFDISELQLP